MLFYYVSSYELRNETGRKDESEVVIGVTVGEQKENQGNFNKFMLGVYYLKGQKNRVIRVVPELKKLFRYILRVKIFSRFENFASDNCPLNCATLMIKN